MYLTLIFQFNDTNKNRELTNEISDKEINSYMNRLAEPPVKLIDDKIFIDMDSEKLPQWIKNFRVSLGWTQSDLKELSTVSLQYISQIERGTFKPAIGTIRKLLHTFLETPYQMNFNDLPDMWGDGPVFEDTVPDDVYNVSASIMDFKNPHKSKFDIECIESIINDTLNQIKSTNDYCLLSFALLSLQLNLKLDEFRKYKTTNQGKEDLIQLYIRELQYAMTEIAKQYKE